MPDNKVPDYLKLVYYGLKAYKKVNKLRDDWHEPDEQGVSATVTGDHLDNAFGSHGGPDYHKEFVVTLRNDNGDQMSINLADLLALASR